MLTLEKNKKNKKNRSFPWRFFCRTQKLFYRQMLTFGFVMSFFIIVLNLVFVIPHLILVIQHEYFANKNFENEYYYRKLVSNSPLSKYRLHFWDGDTLQRYLPHSGFVANKNDLLKGKVGAGFANVTDYFDFSGMHNILGAPFIWDQKKQQVRWNFQYIINDQNQVSFEKILTLLGLNSFATTGSLTISLNMMEGFLAELYHLSAGWKPYERIALIEQVINFYNSPLFKNVICEASGYSQDIAADVSYRDYLSLLLISKLPSFINNSLIYNKKRRRAFNFGENFINNIYQQDILTSHITGKINKHLVQLYGLDFQNNDQQFLLLPKKNQRSWLLNDHLTQQLKQLMTRKMIEEYYDVDQTDQEQDITDEQDHVLYDATTNTLHPPVLINNHLGGILGVNATKRQQLLNQLLSINNTWLTFKSNQQTNHREKPILPQFWVYNDQTANNFLQKKYSSTVLQNYYHTKNTVVPKPQDNEIVPFDPFTLENENFNLQSSNHVNDEYQSLFVDYYYQSSDKQHQHPLPLLRPVYNLLNIYLYLPASLVDLSAFTHADGYATLDSKRYLKVVPASEVPQSVQRGLKYYPQWVKIQPYSPRYDARFSEGMLAGSSPELILNKIKTWGFAAQEKRILNVVDALQNTKNITGLSNLKINPLIIGQIGIDPTNPNLYLPHPWDQLLSGYSLAKVHQFHWQQMYSKDTWQLNNHIQVPLLDNVETSLQKSQNHFWHLSESQAPFLWSNQKFTKTNQNNDLDLNFSQAHWPYSGINDTFSGGDKEPILVNYSLSHLHDQIIKNITVLLTTATLGILILIVLLIVSSVYLVFNMFIRNFQVIVRVLKCDGYRNRELMAFVMSSMVPHLLIGGLISNITLYFVGVALLKWILVRFHFFLSSLFGVFSIGMTLLVMSLIFIIAFWIYYYHLKRIALTHNS